MVHMSKKRAESSSPLIFLLSIIAVGLCLSIAIYVIFLSFIRVPNETKVGWSLGGIGRFSTENLDPRYDMVDIQFGDFSFTLFASLCSITDLLDCFGIFRLFHRRVRKSPKFSGARFIKEQFINLRTTLDNFTARCRRLFPNSTSTSVNAHNFVGLVVFDGTSARYFLSQLVSREVDLSENRYSKWQFQFPAEVHLYISNFGAVGLITLRICYFLGHCFILPRNIVSQSGAPSLQCRIG